MVYHVLNRAVGGGTLFEDEPDYLAFERVIERTLLAVPMRIISYCQMSNHRHLVLWPKAVRIGSMATANSQGVQPGIHPPPTAMARRAEDQSLPTFEFPGAAVKRISPAGTTYC